MPWSLPEGSLPAVSHIWRRMQRRNYQWSFSVDTTHCVVNSIDSSIRTGWRDEAVHFSLQEPHMLCCAFSGDCVCAVNALRSFRRIRCDWAWGAITCSAHYALQPATLFSLPCRGAALHACHLRAAFRLALEGPEVFAPKLCGSILTRAPLRLGRPGPLLALHLNAACGATPVCGLPWGIYTRWEGGVQPHLWHFGFWQKPLYKSTTYGENKRIATPLVVCLLSLLRIGFYPILGLGLAPYFSQIPCFPVIFMTWTGTGFWLIFAT